MQDQLLTLQPELSRQQLFHPQNRAVEVENPVALHALEVVMPGQPGQLISDNPSREPDRNQLSLTHQFAHMPVHGGNPEPRDHPAPELQDFEDRERPANLLEHRPDDRPLTGGAAIGA